MRMIPAQYKIERGRIKVALMLTLSSWFRFPLLFGDEKRTVEWMLLLLWNGFRFCGYQNIVVYEVSHPHRRGSANEA